MKCIFVQDVCNLKGWILMPTREEVWRKLWTLNLLTPKQ